VLPLEEAGAAEQARDLLLLGADLLVGHPKPLAGGLEVLEDDVEQRALRLAADVLDPPAKELLACWRARLMHGRAVPSSDENVARLDELAATVGSLRDETAGLRRALTSREDIDEAKGIIIATRGCPREEAFQALVKMSQDSNVPLKEVARALIYQAVDA
jgi:hypothetical protein